MASPSPCIRYCQPLVYVKYPDAWSCLAVAGRTSSQHRNQCFEEHDDGCVDEMNEHSCSKLMREESDSFLGNSNIFSKRWVANSLDFNKDYDAIVFETTIRVVGGLLSTYDLSGDKIFLDKARDIADRLLPAWNTPSGIPYNIINLSHGRAHNPGWIGGSSILADSGTEQLEFIAPSLEQQLPFCLQWNTSLLLQLIVEHFSSLAAYSGCLSAGNMMVNKNYN
ncbi:hypothetical protein RYX36_034182 [Vicia faba]